jgi:predicted Zn-dependent protease
LQLEDDERRLWSRAREEEGRWEKSGLLYSDPSLTEYVNGIAQRVLPAAARLPGLSIRVHIMQHPLLNAFALPHGSIYIHTGLLARMENEAQLATLLAHEMTHVTHRHAVKCWRSLQNKTAFMATLQVTLAGIPFANLAALLGSVGTLASVYGYGRDLEGQADIEGFKALVQAHYDPKEAARLFVHLQRSVAEEKKPEPFFFGTHPQLQERIDNNALALQLFERYLALHPDASDRGYIEEYMRRLQTEGKQ